MADDQTRGEGINRLRIQMNYDQNDAKGAWTDVAKSDTQRTADLVRGQTLSDVMVHRESHSAPEKE